jgi:hypothetical protein
MNHGVWLGALHLSGNRNRVSQVGLQPNDLVPGLCGALNKVPPRETFGTREKDVHQKENPA